MRLAHCESLTYTIEAEHNRRSVQNGGLGFVAMTLKRG